MISILSKNKFGVRSRPYCLAFFLLSFFPSYSPPLRSTQHGPAPVSAGADRLLDGVSETVEVREAEINNLPGLRRIFIRLQGARREHNELCDRRATQKTDKKTIKMGKLFIADSLSKENQKEEDAWAGKKAELTAGPWCYDMLIT